MTNSNDQTNVIANAVSVMNAVENTATTTTSTGSKSIVIDNKPSDKLDKISDRFDTNIKALGNVITEGIKQINDKQNNPTAIDQTTIAPTNSNTAVNKVQQAVGIPTDMSSADANNYKNIGVVINILTGTYEEIQSINNHLDSINNNVHSIIKNQTITSNLSTNEISRWTKISDIIGKTIQIGKYIQGAEATTLTAPEDTVSVKDTITNLISAVLPKKEKKEEDRKKEKVKKEEKEESEGFFSGILSSILPAPVVKLITGVASVLPKLALIVGGLTVFAPQLKKMLEEFGPKIKAAISQVKVWWTENKPLIIDALKTIGVLLYEAFEEIKPVLWDAIKTGSALLWDALKAGAPILWDIIKKGVVLLWDALKEGAPIIWDAMKAIGPTAVLAITGLISAKLFGIIPVLNVAYKSLSLIIQSGGFILKKVFSGIGSILMRVAPLLSSAASSIMTALPMIGPILIGAIAVGAAAAIGKVIGDKLGKWFSFSGEVEPALSPEEQQKVSQDILNKRNAKLTEEERKQLDADKAAWRAKKTAKTIQSATTNNNSPVLKEKLEYNIHKTPEMHDFIVRGNDVYSFNNKDEILGMKDGGAVKQLLSSNSQNNDKQLFIANKQVSILEQIRDGIILLTKGKPSNGSINIMTSNNTPTKTIPSQTFLRGDFNAAHNLQPI